MAAALPQPQPRVVQRRTFCSYASDQIQAVRQNPALDPADPVMHWHPQLHHYDCIAVPRALTCSESVLRLAKALTTMDKAAESGSNVEELMATVATMQVRAGNLTVVEMERRLARLGMPRFPIYVLLPQPAGAWNPNVVEFVLASPASQIREDNWAIIYVPPFFPRLLPGAGPPAAVGAAHWTFATVLPCTFEPDRTPQKPTIVCGKMPITDPDPRIYWRCQPTKANMTQYLRMREAGRACHCCQQIICPHELAFRVQYPDARLLTMHGEVCFDGAWRAQVIKGGVQDGHRVLLGPSGTVTVVNPEGAKSDHPKMWNHPVVKRPTLDIGNGQQPVALAVFGMEAGAWKGMPRMVKDLMADTMRVKNTFLERWFPFYYWKYDIAVREEEVEIRPYRLRLSLLERRQNTWKTYLKRVVLNYGAYRVGIRCIMASMSLVAGDAFSLRKEMGIVGCFLGAYMGGISPTEVARRMTSLPSVTATFLGAYLAWKATKFTFRSGAQAIADTLHMLHRMAFARVFVELTTEPAVREFGDITGAAMETEKHKEVVSRLAVRKEVTREIATDTFRRAMNETRWAAEVSPQEFEAFLETVVTTPGETAGIPPVDIGNCVTCLRGKTAGKRYRGECRECKKMRQTIPPEPLLGDPLVTYVGRVGIWSRHFRLPKVELKPDVVVQIGRKKMKSYEAVMKVLQNFEIQPTCRGWNSGPMIDGWIPFCFPRGDAVAVQAFLVRLGSKRIHEAIEKPWRLTTRYMVRRAAELTRAHREEFLRHFSGEKLQKMVEAFRAIDDGNAVQFDDPDDPVAKMKGFTKAEKSYSYSLLDMSFESKQEEKPRFICCPSPEFLAEIGLYTHPQLKWLSATFGREGHMFYAGCATPEDMNFWLNMTLRNLPEPVSIVDDITAIDSNHSAKSFAFHRKLRKAQYPHLHPRIEMMYTAEEHIRVRVGPFTLEVTNVNASGVPDTSYKNSAPCLVLRALAVLYGVMDLDTMSDEEIFVALGKLLSMIYTSAAGDDGLTRVPRGLFGKDVMSEEFKTRYQAWWAMSGFTVKVAIIPEHRWRMATYLAMRPVWGGEDYQWAPEPARRLKGMFWQIDNQMHPMAWARGVASQNLQQGRHCPILGDICQWYLDRTHGPVADVSEKYRYSPFHGYKTSGVANDRAKSEFCQDYHVEPRELDLLVGVLARTKAVHVNLGFSALRRVMLEES